MTASGPNGAALALSPSKAGDVEPIVDGRPIASSGFLDRVRVYSSTSSQTRANDVDVKEVLAHLDTAAHLALNARLDEAREQTTAALMITGSLTSQLGALTHAMHSVIRFDAGVPLDPIGDIAAPVSLLLDRANRFPASAEVAYAVGAGTAMAGFPELAVQWSKLIAGCAEEGKDADLVVAGTLIAAIAALQTCDFNEARQLANRAAAHASEIGLDSLGVRASALYGYLGVLEREADTPSNTPQSEAILSVALSSDPVLRIESQVSLALSELVANRYTASLTWIHSALESLPQVTAARAFAEVSAPMMATMLLLTGCTEDAQQLIDLVGPVISVVPSHLAIVSLLRGVSETNVELALGHLHAAAAERSATPMLRGQAELCIGLLLARAGRVDEVSPYMESAVATFRRIGAPGLAVITERELGPAGTAAGPVTQVLLAPESPESPEGTDHLSSSMVQGEKTWVISLLGGFTIESEGQKISLPQSVAAQAIKYLAVRKTVTVDELVDVLWTDIDPAVGGRRLRNILWRIKSVCGELVSRDGNLIRLSEFARSDLSEFETLATLALSSECPHDDAVQYAEEAVSHYRGQLLPGDLYIDWTGSYRESLTLLYVRVLDILLARSLDEGHVSNALGVLQRMIEAEPFEESYYLQAAELYSQSGRTNRARSTLERASRMLNELGISSCPALTQARQRLGLN